MAKGDVHTVPHGPSWANEFEGDPGPTNIHDTKAQAVQEGRELARQREVACNPKPGRFHRASQPLRERPALAVGLTPHESANTHVHAG